MHSTIVKKIFLFLSILIVMTLACNSLQVAVTIPTELPVSSTSLPVTIAPTQIPASTTAIPATAVPTVIPASATLIPATAVPTAMPTVQQPASNGVEVSVGSLSIVLPPGLTYGARGSQLPRVDGENAAWWQKTPGHTQLKLEGYRLQGKTHQPQIYVYPALAYAEMVPGAFENIHRLDNILYGPIAPISADQLPGVPFFNAKQAFASNIQVVSFQNGSGVRFLTEYAQYPVSANNHDLFYHFQGVTRDGEYYIIAILPISIPTLAETSDGGAALPSGGVPYPYFANPKADMQGYYTSVIDVLNAAPQDAFTPTLNQLDLLIQSMRITP